MTVKPETVKSLDDWIARWPRAKNLGFDPETREPTIYADKERKTIVRAIPWKREADTLTVLANPTQFSAQAVAAATSRIGKIREQRNQLAAVGNEQLRAAEANLLDAWRVYEAAPASGKAMLRRDILSAEATMMELEQKLAPKQRIAIEDEMGTHIYVPPMPVARRGISVTGAASEA
jgi:hypothetical protein